MLTRLSSLIEPAELELLLGETNIVIVDLCQTALYQQIHVPGAVHLPGVELLAGHPPIPGLCPPFTKVKALLSGLGIDQTKQIVLYDDEGGGWAGRLAWTLDLAGLTNWSYLNGGMVAWAKEGHPTESTINIATPSEIDIGEKFMNPSVAASRDDILQQLGSDDFAIWDARSPAEYSGAMVRAARGGHIPGAINLEWTEMMDPNRNLRLKTDSQTILQRVGLTRDKTIVTHCQSHHRSSFTYMVARILGYDKISGYDGSWAEWGNLDTTPIDVGL